MIWSEHHSSVVPVVHKKDELPACCEFMCSEKLQSLVNRLVWLAQDVDMVQK